MTVFLPSPAVVGRRTGRLTTLIARMAHSLHSIPAMSAEVERVFSSSKLLISDRLHRLGDDVICAVECMKSWEKAGIAESNEVRKLEETLRALERQPEKL